MSTNNRELFSEWLKSKSVSKPPINLILLAFDEVSEFAVSRKLSKVCIWSISSQSDFKFVRVAISKNQIFRVVHRQAASLFEKSWKYYDSFLACQMRMEKVDDKSNDEKELDLNAISSKEIVRNQNDSEIAAKYPILVKKIAALLKLNGVEFLSANEIDKALGQACRMTTLQNILSSVSWIECKSWRYRYIPSSEPFKLDNSQDIEAINESTEADSAVATQPKWNRKESVLLLEGCLKIQRGEDRKTIIKELSKTLRKMGERAGYSIDDIFRNENGIAWQMKRMEIALTGKVCDVKPNKVFIEVANLYRENIEVFFELLNEAHKAVDDKEIVAEASLRIAEENSSFVDNDIHGDKRENSTQADELQNYDYDPSTILTFTKPELVMYFGAIDSNVASWRDVYKSVINSLCEDYPYQIIELAKNAECTLLSFNADELRSPIFVRDGIYAEGNKSAAEIAGAIRQLLDICKVDYENVVIRYSRENSGSVEEPVSTTNLVGESNIPDLSEIDKRLYEIIENRYVSGFLPGAINFKKIKRFYEEMYSQSLDIDGGAIEESLNKTCLTVNGKYYAPSALMECGLKIRVSDYIEAAIQSKGYVFYDNILTHFGYELTEKIPDAELLRKYLEKEYPQYAALDGYLAKNANIVIDATQEVEQVLFESVFPMSVDKIKALLPHLAEEAIQKVIWHDDRIIVTNNNERFLIDSMGITAEDLESIEIIINEALNVHNCMFGNELLTSIQNQLPGLYESIRDFGDRGIRGAIAYKLKDKFKFNANIICKIGANIDNAEVFRSFAKSERYFTLSALINLKEQIGIGNVYFETVNEVSSRINDNDYVPNEALQFDSAAIDAVLNQIVIGNMCSLKEASNFAIYPSTCYPWTEYLLESYVAKYSDEFKLCHGGYAEGKCCGAVVKKSVSLNSIDDVVVEYLVLNREIQTSKEALERLVDDGFIARKRYKNIEDLLIIAKARRKD